MTYYCRLCGMVLTQRYEVFNNLAYLSYTCPDHPTADQDGREMPQLIEGD
jgi:hypothetical protein